MLYASLQLPLDNHKNRNLQNVYLSQIRENIFLRKFLYTVIGRLCKWRRIPLWFTELWQNLGQINDAMACGSVNCNGKCVVRRMKFMQYMCLCNLSSLLAINRRNKVVLEPWVSPVFAITYLCNQCSIRFDPIPVKVQVSWKYVKVCGYSDHFFILVQSL